MVFLYKAYHFLTLSYSLFNLLSLSSANGIPIQCLPFLNFLPLSVQPSLPFLSQWYSIPIQCLPFLSFVPLSFNLPYLCLASYFQTVPKPCVQFVNLPSHYLATASPTVYNASYTFFTWLHSLVSHPSLCLATSYSHRVPNISSFCHTLC
jgi:hypothetical protein